MKKSIFILFLFSIISFSAQSSKEITDEIRDITTIDTGNNKDYDGDIDLFEKVPTSAYATALEKENREVGSSTKDSLDPKIGSVSTQDLRKVKFNKVKSTTMVQGLPAPYPGENTVKNYCKNDTIGPYSTVTIVDLLTLMDVIKVGDYVTEGGIWTDTLSGAVVNRNYEIDSGSFKGDFKEVYLKYTVGGKSATLKIIIYKPFSAGKDITLNLCSTDSTFNLFDKLVGASDKGKWIYDGKEVSTNSVLNLNPLDLKVGTTYVYRYTTPKTPGTVKFCPGNTAEVKIIVENAYAGENTTLELCEDSFSKKSIIDLRSKLEIKKGNTLSSKGVWTDSLGKTITNSFNIDIGDKKFKKYKLKYRVKTDSCLDSATLTLKIYGRLDPGSSESLELCRSDKPFNIYKKLRKEYKNWDKASKLGLWTYTDSNGKKKVSKTYELMIDPKTFKGGIYSYKTLGVKDKDGKILCAGGVSKVTISFIASYAGLDTNLELCETDKLVTKDKNIMVNLFELMRENKGLVTKITKGGVWTETPSLKAVDSMFKIVLGKTFKLKYTTPLVRGVKRSCNDTATLTFKVFKRLSSGSGKTLKFCETDSLVKVDLFKELGKGTSKKGNWKWTYLNKKFESKTHELKVKLDTCKIKTFVYETLDVKDSSGNILCSGQKTTMEIEIQSPHDSGENTSKMVCINGGVIDLFTLLKNSKSSKGNFYNAKDSIIDLPEKYSPKNLKRDRDTVFTYKISGGKCGDSEAKITLMPKAAPELKPKDQSFCLSKRMPVVADLVIEDSLNYEWYDAIDSSEKLSRDTKLKDGASYFVENIDVNGCRSLRTKMKVTLIPIGGKNCDPCIKDGVTANGDGINDNLDLCNLPEVYPNFILEVYNRLGVLVFVGNNTTELFSGKSNVKNVVFGNELPSGVYYYSLNPNDNKTKLIKGNFYLGR